MRARLQEMATETGTHMQTSAHIHGRWGLISTNKSCLEKSITCCSTLFFSSHHLFSVALLSGGGVPERPIRTPAGIQLMIEVRESTCTREEDGFFLALLPVRMCSCALTRWCRARAGHVCLSHRGNIRRRRGPGRLPGSRAVITHGTSNIAARELPPQRQ